jgi:voltage-gated potassium channel
MEENCENKRSTLKEKTRRIIFDHDTFWGWVFDEVLLVLIILSIAVVMLDSIESFRLQHRGWLLFLEWVFTIIFTIEYIIRVIVAKCRRKYIFSFLGIVDFLAVIPTYLAFFFFPVLQPLIFIRIVRLLRIYRILKLYKFVRAGNLLVLALRNSFRKIFIFMVFILVLVILLGAAVYIVEGGQNGFDSIPLSIYWAVITITTVGYGDIVPITAIGKFLATFIMLLGYSIIAIPTGIVSVEMSRSVVRKDDKDKFCDNCKEPSHAEDAYYCRICGNHLH